MLWERNNFFSSFRKSHHTFFDFVCDEIKQQTQKMSSFTHDIEISTAKQLSNALNIVPISPFHSSSTLSTPSYSLSPPPTTIAPQQLRILTETSQESFSKDVITVIQRIHKFVDYFLETLEANQQSRSSWLPTSNKEKNVYQAKITTSQVESQLKLLKELIDECCSGVTSSEDFFQIISRRAKDIFFWKDRTVLIKDVASIQLPQTPQYYQLIQLITYEDYHRLYQQSIEKFKTIENSTKLYLERRLPLITLQTHLGQLDSLPSQVNLNKLFKYTLHFCDGKIRYLKQILQQTYKFRKRIIKSIVRMYYLISNADQDIDNLNDSLTSVEEIVLNSFDNNEKEENWIGTPHKSNHAVGYGTTIIDQLQINEKVAPLLSSFETQFNIIFTYLTEPLQTIFPEFYASQFKRSSLKLHKLRDRTTHIEKLRFNIDYSSSFRSKMKEKSFNSLFMISQKIKQIEDMRNEFRPLDENHFRVIFEEIQRTIISVGKETKNIKMRQQILKLEQEVINEFIFDQKGNRKWTKGHTTTTILEKSRIKHLNKASSDDFFEENYDQIVSRSSPHGKIRKQSDTYDKHQVLKEATTYLASIKANYGQELLDQSHFRVYLLPKMIRKIEQILLLIPYTQQPLNHQLNKALQNLRYIPFIIKPEINQEKIDIIFYPKINSALFSAFKHNLTEYFRNLSEFAFKLNRESSKQALLEPQLKQFMKTRVNFLSVLLQQMDKFEELAIKVDQMYLVRETHDVSDIGTNSIVLTLLLAEKEIKAQLLSLEDMRVNSSSDRAISLLTTKMLPLFNQSLSQVFEERTKIPNQHTLQKILTLCEKAFKVMSESQQCMETAINVLEDVRNGRSHRNIHDFSVAFSVDLKNLREKLSWVIEETKKYTNLNSERVRRQMVRVDEFLQICQQSGHTSDLIDQKSLYFCTLFRTLTT